MARYFKPPPYEFPVTFVRQGHRGVEAAHGNRNTLNKRFRELYGAKLRELRYRFRHGDASALTEAWAIAAEVRTWEIKGAEPNVLTEIRKRRLETA